MTEWSLPPASPPLDSSLRWNDGWRGGNDGAGQPSLQPRRGRGSCLRRNDGWRQPPTTPHRSTLTPTLSPCRERGPGRGRGSCLRRNDGLSTPLHPAAGFQPPQERRRGSMTTKYIFVTGGVVSSIGKGNLRRGDRAHPQEPGAHGRGAEAGPVPERRPGDDVAVPARRGVRDAGRLRDGPGPRPLRAVHRHRADAQLQHHGGAGVHAAARRGASRRPPGRDDPDGAARDERDQGVHAAGAARGGSGATRPIPAPHPLSFRAKPRNLSGSAPHTRTFPREMFRLRST